MRLTYAQWSGFSSDTPRGSHSSSYSAMLAFSNHDSSFFSRSVASRWLSSPAGVA